MQDVSITMRKNYLNMFESIFSDYNEFSLIDIIETESSIKVIFSYYDNQLTLNIFEPENIFLREIIVSLEDSKPDRMKISPHFFRYDDNINRSILCLIDKEQHILSSYSLDELVKLYLDQIQSLLTLSPRQISVEYLKEFEFYWNAACKTIGDIDLRAEIYLPASTSASLLQCLFSKKKKTERYIIFPEDVVFNSYNISEGSKSTAVYIPIEFPEGIIPPRSDSPWKADEILSIIYNQTIDRISSDSFNFLRNLQIDNYKKIVVFSFSLANSVSISVVGILSFYNNKRKNFIRKIQDDFVSFTPIRSSRMDLKYLHERVGQTHRDPPSVLLIGCGSVGSYILPELVNLGIIDIGISDPDIFRSGNAFRHYLGPRSDGIEKTHEMKLFIEFENPLVSIEKISDLLSMDDNALSEVIEKYQIIIVAVGGTDLQRKFNYRFSKIKSTSWFLYSWLDAEGKGSHVLAMRYSKKGCFDCLFYNNGEFSAQNKVSYADGSEKIIGNGCNGSFSPYGNNVLIRNTSLVISMLQGILNDLVKENTVASIRNDFSSLESSIVMNPDIDDCFAEERCEVCGHL